MEIMPFLAEKLPAIVFFAEVLFFSLVEKRLWNTLFTPLNCMMWPYAFVVAVCLCVSGRMGYVYFDYSSIWVYVAGLSVFFVPSFFFGLLHAAGSPGKAGRKWADPEPWVWTLLSRLTVVVLSLFLLWLAYLVLTCPFPVGSDEFGARFAGQGIFGHLYTLLMILGVIWMYKFDFRENLKYLPYVAGFLVAAVVYQVKGWLLVPILSAVILRLVSGKMRLRPRTLVFIGLTGFFFFFLTYWINMFVVGSEEGMARYNISQSEYAKSTFEYIRKHFVTYMTAGVYGFSQDVAMGIVEEKDPDMIFAPFVNISNLFTGKEMVKPLNEHFLTITRLDNGTNVRSLMGTLYVYLGGWGAAAFLFVASALTNMLFLIARQRRYFFLWVFMAWLFGLLAMAWFDSYVQTLNFITFPLFLLCLWAFCFYEKLRRESRILC